MRVRITIAAAVALLLALIGSPFPGDDRAARAQERSGGTELMRALLGEVYRLADPQHNPFMNEERLARIEAVAEPADSENLARYLLIRGQEQLLAGYSVEAIASYERLLDLLDADPSLPFSVQARKNVLVSLALAHLRRGEQENCVVDHNIERCLLPIRGEGVHSRPEGSRAAVAVYADLLEGDPEDLDLRWLLNLAAMTLGEHPDGVPERWRIPSEAFAPQDDIGRFRDVAPALGVDVFGLSGGAIVDDFTGDGLLDIVASAWGLREQIRFFVNDGRGGFVDSTSASGLDGLFGGLNLVQADYDNDGHLDFLVLRGAWLADDGKHPNSLVRNLGPGADGITRFRDATEDAGLMTFHPTKVGAWGDYDNDGWLDLFIGNESTIGITHPAELFHNEGPDADGRVRFREVALESGTALIAYIKGAVWGDVDNDGRLDLYVSNLSGAGPNFLFHNDGPGTDGVWRFHDGTARLGVEGPPNSFPSWFFDYDNDGWLDLFASGYRGSIGNLAAEYLGRGRSEGEAPRLYRNLGRTATLTVSGPPFEDVTERVGLDRLLLSMGANFGDLDNDGFLDFYVGTGDTGLQTLMPNRMFRNDGGLRFLDVTTSGGFGHLQKGHGIAFGDLDNDGDQDIYTVMGGAHSGDGFHNALFLNPGHGRRWISFDLEGVKANRSAIGARVRVTVTERGTSRDIHRMVGSGGSFGASSLRLEVGLGTAETVDEVEIRWPGSGVQRFGPLDPDRIYRVREGEEPVVVELPSIEL